MLRAITESAVEQVVLDILAGLGYKVIYGPDIAPDGAKPERQINGGSVISKKETTANENIRSKLTKLLQIGDAI